MFHHSVSSVKTAHNLTPAKRDITTVVSDQRSCFSRGLCIRRKVSFEARNVTEGRFGEGASDGWNASPTNDGCD